MLSRWWLGYVRCDTLHVEVLFGLAAASVTPPLGVLSVETAEGAVLVGINRKAAGDLIQQLLLLIADAVET